MTDDQIFYALETLCDEEEAPTGNGYLLIPDVRALIGAREPRA